MYPSIGRNLDWWCQCAQHGYDASHLYLQYNHYFDTTYDTDFNKQEPKIPEDAKGLKSEYNTNKMD